MLSGGRRVGVSVSSPVPRRPLPRELVPSSPEQVGPQNLKGDNMSQLDYYFGPCPECGRGGETPPTATPERDPVMDVPEVAAWMHVSTKTVYRLVRSGMLDAFKVGAAVRVRRSSVERFMGGAA